MDRYYIRIGTARDKTWPTFRWLIPIRKPSPKVPIIFMKMNCYDPLCHSLKWVFI